MESFSAGPLGLIATRRTVESRYLAEAMSRLSPEKKFYPQEAPALVRLVNDSLYTSTPAVREREIAAVLEPMLKKNIQGLILGCTHFNHLKGDIANLYPHLQLFDTTERVTANALAALPPLSTPQKNGESDFWFDTIPVFPKNFIPAAERFSLEY